MERVRLLLIRHGQAPSNVAGALDTAFPGARLTALGQRQAAAARDALAGEEIAAVYASPLARAMSTAAALAGARGLEVTVLEGLEEIAAGALEMRTDEESIETYRDVVARWIRGELEVPMPGAPDGRAFLSRYGAAMDAIADRHGDDTVAVVSHGAAIRVWTAQHSDEPVDDLEERYLRNTGMNVLERRPGTGWRLVSWHADPLGGAHLVDERAVDPTADQGDEELREAG